MKNLFLTSIVLHYNTKCTMKLVSTIKLATMLLLFFKYVNPARII